MQRGKRGARETIPYGGDAGSGAWVLREGAVSQGAGAKEDRDKLDMEADIERRTCKDVLILIVEDGGVGQEGDWRVVVMSKGEEPQRVS